MSNSDALAMKNSTPAGWQWKPLQELAGFEKGRVVATRPHSGDGYIPYIGAENFAGDFSQFTNDEEATRCEPSDVLMLWDGERSGLCATGLSGAIGSTVARLRPRNGVDGRFLYHQLARHFTWIQARRTGTGVPHVPKDLGRILHLPISKEQNEQSRIALVLDTVDELIERTEAVVAKLKQVRAGLLHDLLTRGLDAHGRLRPPPAQAPHLYKDSPLGPIPKEWDVAPLDRLADLRFSNVDKISKGGEIPIHLCNYTDVYNNFYITGDLPFMRATATAEEIDRFRLQQGDVIITKDSETPDDIAIPAVVDFTHEQLVCGYHLAMIRPEEGKVEPRFLANQFKHQRLAKYFGQQANGITRYGLPISAVSKAPISLPPFVEQRAISACLRSIDELLAQERGELAKLYHLKSGLMEDLLTGRVRVPESVAVGS